MMMSGNEMISSIVLPSEVIECGNEKCMSVTTAIWWTYIMANDDQSHIMFPNEFKQTREDEFTLLNTIHLVSSSK